MILKRLFISILAALLLVSFVLNQTLASQIEPNLSTTVDAGVMERVIVRLTSPSLPHRPPNTPELVQRTAVIAQLQQTAVSSQAALINPCGLLTPLW